MIIWGIFRSQLNIYDRSFCENSKQLKTEGEIHVAFYFTSFSLAIYLWFKLIHLVEHVSDDDYAGREKVRDK